MKNTRKVTREQYAELFPKQDLDQDWYYITGFDESAYKSDAQNKLFHSLLSCFLDSGCHSFRDYDHMRRHYKTMAGLIEWQVMPVLLKETANAVWRCIKILKQNTVISDAEFNKVLGLLSGKILIEKSWASVKKKDAKIAIDLLIHDMDQAGVITSSVGNKYQEILEGVGEIC